MPQPYHSNGGPSGLFQEQLQSMWHNLLNFPWLIYISTILFTLKILMPCCSCGLEKILNYKNGRFWIEAKVVPMRVQSSCWNVVCETVPLVTLSHTICPRYSEIQHFLFSDHFNSLWPSDFMWHHGQLIIDLGQHWFRSLQWRHNGHNGGSNLQPHHCLLNCLFRCR